MSQGREAVRPLLHNYLGAPGGRCISSIFGAICGREAGDHASEVVPSPVKEPNANFHDEEIGPEGYDVISSTPLTTIEGAISFFEECVDLIRVKNEAYGDAWKSQGYMGNLARVMSKTSRLKSLLWGDHIPHSEANEETISDTLKDLGNLCYFMARNYQEGNRWGS